MYFENALNLLLQITYYTLIFKNLLPLQKIVTCVSLILLVLSNITLMVSIQNVQEISYRKQIARKLRTQYVEGIYDNFMTLKPTLTVTQGHWKRNH